MLCSFVFLFCGVVLILFLCWMSLVICLAWVSEYVCDGLCVVSDVCSSSYAVAQTHRSSWCVITGEWGRFHKLRQRTETLSVYTNTHSHSRNTQKSWCTVWRKTLPTCHKSCKHVLDKVMLVFSRKILIFIHIFNCFQLFLYLFLIITKYIVI